MSLKTYIDKIGITYLYNKLKNIFVHKTGDEEISGVKTLIGSNTTLEQVGTSNEYSTEATELIISNLNHTKGTPTSGSNLSYTQLIFADSSKQGLAGRTGFIIYKHPNESNANPYVRIGIQYKDVNNDEQRNQITFGYSVNHNLPYLCSNVLTSFVLTDEDHLITRSYLYTQADGFTQTLSSKDLNNLTEPGSYYIGDAGYTNMPSGVVNGILVVHASKDKVHVKQIFYRWGTRNSNDHQTYVREGDITSSGTPWSDWQRFMTFKDVIPVANGGTGLTSLDTFVRTTGNQTISGTKTFNGGIHEYSANISGSTAPSSDQFLGLHFYNNNKAARMSGVEFAARSNGNRDIKVFVVPRSSGDWDGLQIGIDSTAANSWIQPMSNGLAILGASSHKWKQLYASTTTISTSDKRLKSEIQDIDDDLLDAWEQVKLVKFKFKEAISKKGVDDARYHTGVIAQQIQEVFASKNIDPSKYSFFCYDEWDDEPEQIDENGNIMQKATKAGNCYSIRYEDALCIEAAYQRRRADRLEAEIMKIKQYLNIE